MTTSPTFYPILKLLDKSTLHYCHYFSNFSSEPRFRVQHLHIVGLQYILYQLLIRSAFAEFPDHHIQSSQLCFKLLLRIGFFLNYHCMHKYARSVCISNDLGNPSKIHVCPVGCRELLDKPYERSLAPNDRLSYSNHSREWSHPRKDLSHVMKVHLDGIYRVYKKK